MVAKASTSIKPVANKCVSLFISELLKLIFEPIRSESSVKKRYEH